MPWDEEMANAQAQQVELKKLQGAILGAAFGEMIKRVSDHPEEISLAEWTELADKWLQREETVESFNRAIGFCRSNPVFYLPVGDPENPVLTVEEEMMPGRSRSFVEAFLTYVAVDIKVMFLEKTKDQVGYFAFLLAGRKVEREHRRVTPSEELGMG